MAGSNTEPNIETLALFPLGQVLYPSVAIKLKIFEQRYLKLVRDSMRSGQGFGVVPIIQGSEVGEAPDFFPCGTRVNIIDFDQQADGLLEITIMGVERIKVQNSWLEDNGLIVAKIENLPRENEEAITSDQQDLRQLLDDLMSGLRITWYFPDDTTSQSALSWRLATLLPLDNNTKMAILAEDKTEQRLLMLRKALQKLFKESN